MANVTRSPVDVPPPAGPVATGRNDIVATRELTADFGPFRALDHVSLVVRRGSITGLIGPNGAGKTTLFNTLTGSLRPTSGQVLLDGEEVTGLTPDILFRRGLSRTFQIPRPFARMSVLENVLLGPGGQVGETISGAILRSAAVRRQEEAAREKALDILRFMTIAHLADHPAGKISGGQTKLLELARVLMADPAVVLLDEPAAGVNPALAQILIDRIEKLNRGGTSFFIIEHNMDFVMRHCEPVIALAEGKIIFEGTADEALADKVLLEAYLGAQAQ